jgi:hypothetical protein
MASGLLDLDLVPSISVETIIVTAGISIGVGLLFGTYPAYKAALLMPCGTNNIKLLPHTFAAIYT